MTDLRIEFDTQDPPAGRVVTRDEVVTFAGWLALLRRLEETLEQPPRRQVRSGQRGSVG